MPRTATLLALFFALLLNGGLAVTGRPLPAARPNIVFILVDDLRWDELGIAGHPFILTRSVFGVRRLDAALVGPSISHRLKETDHCIEFICSAIR